MPAPMIIGWRERVSFPDWGIRGVRAKIDTGARTSALHVGVIEPEVDGRIRFEVVVREQPRPVHAWVEAPVVREGVVKPHAGVREVRPVVLARVRIGPFEREIEVNLVCRRGMTCRMLVGRTALEGLLIDPTRIRLLTPPRPRPQGGSS
ncbi:MAG: ATP-dependent zinc protease [Phycisphaerales bacterium]|nr:ATP-dependent zinc protease [Phycisphaerales bacterium]